MAVRTTAAVVAVVVQYASVMMPLLCQGLPAAAATTLAAATAAPTAAVMVSKVGCIPVAPAELPCLPCPYRSTSLLQLLLVPAYLTKQRQLQPACSRLQQQQWEEGLWLVRVAAITMVFSPLEPTWLLLMCQGSRGLSSGLMYSRDRVPARHRDCSPLLLLRCSLLGSSSSSATSSNNSINTSSSSRDCPTRLPLVPAAAAGLPGSTVAAGALSSCGRSTAAAVQVCYCMSHCWLRAAARSAVAGAAPALLQGFPVVAGKRGSLRVLLGLVCSRRVM